jgi:hypothetical protein
MQTWGVEAQQLLYYYESEGAEKSGGNSDGESDCTSDYPSGSSDTEWLG